MTLFELTRALARRKRFVIVASLVVVLAAMVATLKLEDGSVSWRSGQKWEAEVQIAVVSPGNDSLTNAETRTERIGSAILYSRVLETGEAAEWVGSRNGFEPTERITSTVQAGSSLISAKVIGPSEAQTAGAARSIFEYLTLKLEEPLSLPDRVTATTIPITEISGPFESEMTLTLAAGLEGVADTLFIRASTEIGSDLTLPVVGFSGQSVTIGATLRPVTTLLLTLQESGGAQLDTMLLAADPVGGIVAFYPALVVALDESAIVSDDSGEERTWRLNAAGITTSWVPGGSVGAIGGPSVVPVEVALITPDPVAEPIGGRAGPIVLGGFLFLGVIMILTVAIVGETWSRQRAEAAVGIEAGPAGDDLLLSPYSVWGSSDIDDQTEATIGPVSRLSRWEARGVESDAD